MFVKSLELVPKLVMRSDMFTFTAVFERVDEWWVAYVEELPGANTQGETLDEARENLKEAVQLIIEANREISKRTSSSSTVIREELLVTV